MLFASLVFERVPLTWNRFPDAFCVWLQNAGAVSAFAIAVVLVARWLQRDVRELDFWSFPARFQPLFTAAFKYCLIASGLGYLAVILLWLGKYVGFHGLAPYLPALAYWILTASGALALFVAVAPIAFDLFTRVSWGRIWAIARLSWKEAVRGRVIWVFGAMSLVFLFAEWFVPYKAEDQVRSYVRVVYWSMTPLFLLTAGLLGAFSIPNDVKNNSIHTIVTKPVEKIEIVLGRFFGYAAILTVGLFAVALLSLIYVERGVNDKAKEESYKARVPIYGLLHFAGTEQSLRGDSVGREFERRSYIRGMTKRNPLRQYAIWDFFGIPTDVVAREDPVVFEFDFDIYRLSKGEEGKGLFCTFTFVDIEKFRNEDPNGQAQELDTRTNLLNQERERLKERARKARDAAGKRKDDKAFEEEIMKIDQDLLEEYRIFQISTVEVSDYHTDVITVPSAAMRTLVAENAAGKVIDGFPQPVLRVFVTVDLSAESQMLGVAQPDFYLLAYENPFWLNFLKGVAGMWCTHMLILGVVLALSTYLSGVISLLGGMFLFLAGMFTDFLLEIATPGMVGGGPTIAFMRLSTKTPIAGQLDSGPTTDVMQLLDRAFSWWIGRILNLIPDVNRHDLHQYVANGFDIGWTDVLLLDNVLPLFGYLAPWFFLAYYLMKYREIANPQ